MSKNDQQPPPEPKPRRDSFVIADELEAAKARFVELEAQNRDYHLKRGRAAVRFRKFEESWAKENPDTPYEPEDVPAGAVVPPRDAPAGREFHRQHYVIGALEAELEAAKKAETGQ